MNHDIISTLMRLGAASAETIAKSLGVSQPTVSRLISANAGQIIRVGGSKNTIYGVARKIRQLPEPVIPVFRIDETGNASPFGHLSAINPEGFLWSFSDMQWPLESSTKQYFYSIPYFIQDSRPQGFMGRNFAHMNADALGVPSNPERWSDDDIIVAMSIMGDDLTGDLIVGETSYRRFTERKPSIIHNNDIEKTYLELAQLSVSTGIAGSSAAGEFPKFTAIREREGSTDYVIVKFSGSGYSATEQRWSDLLRCEVHASEILNQFLGVLSAKSIAISYGGRTFMESVRFDRVGLTGRRSMCSLASLDAELVGMGDPDWDKFADKLLKIRVIDAKSASAMRKAWYFGKLIGNSDMHAGNLSFCLYDSNKVELSPIYDMLPMRYAPLRGGEVPEFEQQANLYVPMPGHGAEFNMAKLAAIKFWNAVTLDEKISSRFRMIAKSWTNQLI